MACKSNSHCTDGISYHVYDSLNCKGCCSGESLSPPRDKTHVHFSQESNLCDEGEIYGAENSQFPAGVCICCKDPPCQPFPKSCQNFGRPVLVYEIPSPKFEGLSTHQRDFGPKPVPVKKMPPWHPILKDRWKSIDVPSLKKTTYQSDFTPQVATLECRKPVYLAPKVKKDRCEELSETFKTWRKTSKGPSQTHEVCDKPVVVETTIVCKEPIISSVEHDHHDNSGYQNDNDMNQLHGPECEKHCYSAPLMCHVRSPNFNSEGHQCYDNGMIPVQRNCNIVQTGAVKGGFVRPEKSHRHAGLLDCEAIEVRPTQKAADCANLNFENHRHFDVEDENKEFNQDLCPPDVANRHSCYTSESHPINSLATTCITMNHPAGDGNGHFHSKEEYKVPYESCQDHSHNRRLKHVHFAENPEVFSVPPTTQIPGVCHSSPAEDMHCIVKHPCSTPQSATNSNTFTLCEDRRNNPPTHWWKDTSCEPPRINVAVNDVPQDVTRPFCPSYLTIHQKDFREPCLGRQSCADYTILPEDCGCTGKATENFLCPEFERGGLI